MVLTRHRYAAEAHQAAHTRTTRGYSTLWHDLLVDVQEAFGGRGCDLYKLAPAGYKVPIVNGCILYVWRIPVSNDPAHFATSPTKMSCFDAVVPEPALFDAAFVGASSVPAGDSVDEPEQEVDLSAVVSSVDGTVPVVLVMVDSSPQQLRSIGWAVAELDRESGEVGFHGQETIWQPEPVVESDATGVESFDSGTPIPPAVEPREQEGTDPDAR
ncbi:MAG: hypothetical protein QM662_16250 [Gordonia sp. (in: high G+C Gram-positive bacteria)]